MKKLLIMLAILMFCSVGYADTRRQNSYSTWINLTTSQTLTFPYQSQDVYISNGSSVAICVNLKGTAPNPSCDTSSNTNVILAGSSSLNLNDYVTDSIAFSPMSGAASPVSVVVTY